ncbi:MAG TPA: peptidoglycan-binding protein [Solirubrobacteraceae bacterium]|nr:peptidoglycan-binding protein [Solirubrobacteraceae bacterium]
MEPPRVEDPHEAATETWVPDGAASPDTESPSAASNTRRRRRLAAGGAVLLAAAAVAVVLIAESGASGKYGSGNGVPPGETTTAVARRTLTESSTVDGTLGYGSALELYDRLSGTFTWLPAVGAVIVRGGTLWRVNNEPVALMYGAVPAYRTLKKGVSDGPDVTELNENLIDLGYDPYRTIADDEAFSEATAAAVRRWQHAQGLSETGKVELGRIVFAPGARRVTGVKVALGQDPPGSAGAKEPAAEGQDSKEPSSEKKPPSKEPSSKDPDSKKSSHKKPASKKKEPSSKKGEPGSKKEEPGSKEPGPKEEPSSKDPPSKGPGASESGAGAGMVVLSTTSTQQLIQLKVKAEQQTLAHVGQSAPVTLPGGGVVRGRIIAVGSVASSAAGEGEKEKGGGGEKSGEGESATIPVTLALERPVAHLDEAPVSVELVKSIRRDVLAVPATALTATAGGGYAIEVLEGLRRVELAVTPGTFANGYVQVEGQGVREGLTVIEAR